MTPTAPHVAKWLAACLAAATLCAPTRPAAAEEAETAAAAPAPRRRAPRTSSPYKPVKMTHRGSLYYASAWGVDRLKVSSTASGNLIRFSYRVVDPERAKVLGDKGATPYLVGQRSRVVLQIPVMEKVGPLRQGGSARPGREYWMTFSNKGQPVKPGDRVDVVIGAFHAEGLVVE